MEKLDTRQEHNWITNHNNNESDDARVVREKYRNQANIFLTQI